MSQARSNEKRTPNQTWWRDVLGALTLANLSLFPLWNTLLNYRAEDVFYAESVPGPEQYAAAIVDVLIYGAFFFALIRMLRVVQCGFWALPLIGLIILLPLSSINNLSTIHLPQMPMSIAALGRGGNRALSFAVMILVIAVLIFLTRRFAYRKGFALLLILSPLMAVEICFAVRNCIRDAPAAAPPLALKASNTNITGPRVVWIIFDELDYRLAFEDRPANLAMREFDRLRAESIYATHAMPPANDTHLSIPSLLTGITLTAVTPVNALDAVIEAPGFHARIKEQPTVFSSVRAMGGNAAIAGWYMPYCRVYSSDLTECFWRDRTTRLTNLRGTFSQLVWKQAVFSFEGESFSPLPKSLAAQHHLPELDEIRAAALRDASDSSYNLVFLHLPLPHAPFLYDRFQHTFSKRDTGPVADTSGYVDNLALADAWLGDIRNTMTRSGEWDRSAVIVSSDHHFRRSTELDGKEDLRVPFLLKLPGQNAGEPYDPLIETVSTKKLIESILRGEIESQAQGISWLNRNACAKSRAR